jgi:flagellar biogenesis protein FliO
MSPQATGAAGTGASTTPGVPGGGLASLSLRLGLALALIVALILAAGFVLRRAVGTRSGGAAPGRLQIVDRLDLAPKRALYGVRAGGRVVVVGVTETSIAPVFELSPEDAAALYPPGDAPRGTGFANLLQLVTQKAGMP